VNVYCYFDDSEHAQVNQSTMLRVWVRSWSARGWKPRILTIRNAMRHKSFAAFKHDYREWPRLAQEVEKVKWLCPVETINFSLTTKLYKSGGLTHARPYLSAGWETSSLVFFENIHDTEVIEHCGRAL